jgi:hypothetical protein
VSACGGITTFLEEPEWRRQDSCFYIKEPYGGYCPHADHWQQGGGKTSPDHSYIYCDYLEKKIYVEPPLANLASFKDLKEILIPVGCPVITRQEQGSLF